MELADLINSPACTRVPVNRLAGRNRNRLVSALAGLLLALPLNAGAPPRHDLTEASLEELMNIDVSSVSRKEQKLSRTAAAVYVVSADDIRRSGATSIPEALRMVPGVHVERIDANNWAVSTRGFDTHYSNKMLVLIDGRSIYNNVFSGVSWDQYDLVMEDIDRIEVIRGPGGTMWGANAVNGVINIITRKAADTQGLLASFTTGNEDLSATAVRYGGKKGDRLAYRLFGKQAARNQMISESLLDAHDSSNKVQGGGRLEYRAGESDSFTFHGNLYRGRAGAQYFTTFPVTNPNFTSSDLVRSSGGYLLGRWLHHHESGAETALQVYYNVENLSESMASIYMKTLDFDFQQRLSPWKRNELMWGAGYRSYSDHTTAGVLASFVPQDRRDSLYSSWLQDELSLIPDRLVLTAGVKVQNNSYTGIETQPSVRLYLEPKANHSVWMSTSKAVRTPVRRDTDLLLQFRLPYDSPIPVVGILTGNPNLPSEHVHTYEAGYRTQIAGRVAVDLAVFQNHYEDLQTIQMGGPSLITTPSPAIQLPITFTHQGTARVHGAEAATTWTLRPNWKVTGNYAWMRSRLREGDTVSMVGLASAGAVYPSHQAFVRSSYDFRRTWSFDTTLYFLSRIHGNPVPASVRVDFRIGYRPNESSEWSFGMANLLDPRHVEFAPEDYAVRSQIPRSFQVRFTWGR